MFSEEQPIDVHLIIKWRKIKSNLKVGEWADSKSWQVKKYTFCPLSVMRGCLLLRLSKFIIFCKNSQFCKLWHEMIKGSAPAPLSPPPSRNAMCLLNGAMKSLYNLHITLIIFILKKKYEQDFDTKEIVFCLC